jgi:hypothetical protein
VRGKIKIQEYNINFGGGVERPLPLFREVISMFKFDKKKESKKEEKGEKKEKGKKESKGKKFPKELFKKGKK